MVEGHRLVNDGGALPIVWRDDHCVVFIKPAGWLVHRTGLDAGETRFVVQHLREQLGQKVFPVHRLDKGTSGLMVMALHPGAAARLASAFQAHEVEKRYLALVRGWAPERADVDHALRPEDAPPDAPPQAAHTRLQCVATLSLPVPVDRYPTTRASVVQAWPSTGRRHQIRRHLKHLAHPILGDATHGKGAHNRWWAERWGQQRLWLHASALCLPHPHTGRRMDWHVDPLDARDRGLWPDALADWSAVLGGEPWQWASGHCSVDEPGA